MFVISKLPKWRTIFRLATNSFMWLFFFFHFTAAINPALTSGHLSRLLHAGVMLDWMPLWNSTQNPHGFPVHTERRRRAWDTCFTLPGLAWCFPQRRIVRSSVARCVPGSCVWHESPPHNNDFLMLWDRPTGFSNSSGFFLADLLHFETWNEAIKQTESKRDVM